MRKPRGKRAKHNKRSAAELSAKRHRSEEPGVHVCLPFYDYILFYDKLTARDPKESISLSDNITNHLGTQK